MKKDFNYVKWGIPAFILSGILIAVSIYSFWTKGLNLGIDFKGGLSIEAQLSQEANLSEIRTQLSGLDLKDVSLQSIGANGREILISASVDTADEKSVSAVVERIQSILPADTEYTKVEAIGPKVGNELFNKSLWASVVALIAIALYIWFRFEWQFSISAILALAHDLVLTIGFFSVFGLDFNLTVVAGILSLAGYGTNDTVVTFDRIRENLKKYRKSSLKDILNKSMTQTLGRSVLTTLSTMFVLITLIIFGTDALDGFSISMLVGVIISFYSSIFLAVPMLYFLNARPNDMDENN